MFDGVSLCPNLLSKEKCFRVQRYQEGAFHEEFHEHVPRSRMNIDEGTEAIRALVIRFTNMPGHAILRALLNRRGATPAASSVLSVHVSYPEPGVLRKACGGDMIAWIDEVVSEQYFRPPGTGHESTRRSTC